MFGATSARSASLAAVLASAAAALGFSATNAQAASCSFTDPALPAAQWDIVPPSCFEGGDGNLAVDNAKGTGRTDWSTISATTAADASGAADVAFASGAGGKEFNPLAWRLVSGPVTPAKIDLLAEATKVDPVSGNLFLYAAFLRKGDSGDADLSFELNSSATLWDNDSDAATPSVPTRTAGDVLLTFDGGANATVGICRWVGPKEGTGTDPDAGWYTVSLSPVKIGAGQECTPLTSLASPHALGGMNATAALDNLDAGGPARYLSGFPDTIPQNTFGEVTVNLTEALTTLAEPDPCFDFGSIWMHSRNSTSSSADMGDYFSPVALVGAKTCAIAVDKQVKVNGGSYQQGAAATPASASTGDTLTYKFDVTNGGQASITGVTVSDALCDAGTLSAVFDTHGDTTPTSLDPDDTWTKTCTRVYRATDANTLLNTVTASGAIGTKTVTKTDTANVRRLARLTLVKDQTGGSNALAFDFTVPSALEGSGTKSLSEADGAKLYAGLAPGTYPVTEQTTTGWELKALNCVTTGTQTTDPQTTTSLATRTATVDLASGDDVTCTFANTKNTTLTIVKQVTNDNGGSKAASDFSIAYTSASGDGTVTGSTAGVKTIVSPGPFTVTETPPTGYAQSYSGDCSGTLTVGQDAVCTVTNDDIAPTPGAAGGVLGVTIWSKKPVVVRGRSALAGPNGCVARRTAKAYVTGRQIAQVRFVLDGRTVATVTKADRQGRWMTTLTTKRLATGKHRVRAVVRYRASSQTSARVLALSFARCVAARLPATVG